MRRFSQAIAASESMSSGLPTSLVDALVDAPDRYNIGKTKPAAVIVKDPEGELAVIDMTWGLVPRWSKEPETRYTTVTARLDKAPGSRIYAQAWKQRRCVIAMTGYYKWDRHSRPPWPMFVQRKDGLALLAAGLWEHWRDEGGRALNSFAVLTAPNGGIPAPLTADGPVFVNDAVALAWIAGEFETAASLQRQSNTPELEAYPVSKAFRDPEVDQYTLLEPVERKEANAVAASDWDDDPLEADEDDD